MKNVKFIKVLNPIKAKQLENLGFKYTLEKFNGEDLFVFQITDELVKQVQSTFSKNDFFIDKTMNF